MKRPGLGVAVLTAVSLVGVTAHGQPTAGDAERRASALATQGLQAFDRGDYKEALASFERARQAWAGDPLILYFIGGAAEKALRLERAAVAYEQYLHAGAGLEHAAEVKASLNRLRRRLPGTLEIACKPAGALVQIDGEAGVSCPARLAELPPGRHRFRVSKEGWLPATRGFEIVPSTTTREMVELLPDRPAATPPPSTSMGAPTPPPPPPVVRRSAVGTWVVGGLGAAGMGVMAVALGVQAGAEDGARRANGLDRDEFRASSDRARTAHAVAWGAGLAGGAALAWSAWRILTATP